MTIQFESFPKLHRFTGPIVISEKIDGTNACVVIEGDEIAAQSRTRIITPEKDNHGFARWVYANKEALIAVLGDGRHYGEWWGNGIQRGYGLKEKRFQYGALGEYARTKRDRCVRRSCALDWNI